MGFTVRGSVLERRGIKASFQLAPFANDCGLQFHDRGYFVISISLSIVGEKPEYVQRYRTTVGDIPYKSDSDNWLSLSLFNLPLQNLNRCSSHITKPN